MPRSKKSVCLCDQVKKEECRCNGNCVCHTWCDDCLGTTKRKVCDFKKCECDCHDEHFIPNPSLVGE